MSKKTLLKEPYTEIFIDQSDGVLYARWSGFLTTSQVKKGCSVMSDFIKKNHTAVHLSDHRDLKVLSKDVQDYLTGTWFPEVEKAGMTKIAALVSEDVFAKATVDKVNSEGQKVTMGRLEIGTFMSEQDCISWLTS